MELYSVFREYYDGDELVGTFSEVHMARELAENTPNAYILIHHLNVECDGCANTETWYPGE